MRRYAGGQAYSVEALKGVLADDFAEADGVSALSFAQAQRAVETKSPKPKGGALTVRAAIEQYLIHQSDSGKSIDDARYRVDALILPSLGESRWGISPPTGCAIGSPLWPGRRPEGEKSP